MEVRNLNAARELFLDELLAASAAPASAEQEELLALLRSERIVLAHAGQPLSEAQVLLSLIHICLFDYARPQLELHGLLRPGDFRRALRDLRLALTLPRQPALQAAACLLGERDEDERLLQMALNLLHKV